MLYKFRVVLVHHILDYMVASTYLVGSIDYATKSNASSFVLYGGYDHVEQVDLNNHGAIFDVAVLLLDCWL